MECPKCKSHNVTVEMVHVNPKDICKTRVDYGCQCGDRWTADHDLYDAAYDLQEMLDMKGYKEGGDGSLVDADGNTVWCSSPWCEAPAMTAREASTDKTGDSLRFYCASCVEAFDVGLQHGRMSIRSPKEVTVATA